jgi:signal transduction histidine kinase
MAIKIDTVDLESVFHEAFEVFNLQLEGSAVELYYDSENSSCIIETDRLRFMQVLTNYMTNAIKYTDAGHIRLGYECIDTGIRIFVEDTGKGIPEENVEQVFERFEKIGSFVQGTGLGLSICRDIAKLLGGYVWVDSEYGKGSTFWMYIPTKYTITKK